MFVSSSSSIWFIVRLLILGSTISDVAPSTFYHTPNADRTTTSSTTQTDTQSSPAYNSNGILSYSIVKIPTATQSSNSNLTTTKEFLDVSQQNVYHSNNTSNTLVEESSCISPNNDDKEKECNADVLDGDNKHSDPKYHIYLRNALLNHNIDSDGGNRPYVREIDIDNDLFKGKMLLFLRVPSTSKNNNIIENHSSNNNINHHYDFGGDKNIKWEVQIQGKFKRIPDGPLYLAVELPETKKLNWGLRVFGNAFCKMIRFFGYDVEKSFGEKGDAPHFSSVAYQAFDKISYTSDNNTTSIPKLGQEIYEPYESAMNRRTNRGNEEHIIDTSLLYTLSFNDTFFDPVEWQVTGIPLFKDGIDMSGFANAIRLVVYEVTEVNNEIFLSSERRKKGDFRASAPKGKSHTKRNVAFWFEFHNPKSDQSN